MTRQRKEIYKEMDRLEMQMMAEYELGCGYFGKEIQEAYEPYQTRLEEELAATYGLTAKELCDIRYEKLLEAYDAGRIPWSPCYGI